MVLDHNSKYYEMLIMDNKILSISHEYFNKLCKIKFFDTLILRIIGQSNGAKFIVVNILLLKYVFIRLFNICH